MSPNPIWTRRIFVSTLGLTGAAALAPRLHASPKIAPGPSPTMAFAGFSGPTASRIESYRIVDGAWTLATAPLQTESPHALALHPTLPILYAAHNTDQHNHLPRGSVSAFKIDPATGTLTPLSHQPLSLSATNPEHLTVSPNGKTLLVSASTGGSWNLFSLTGTGEITPVPYALKQIGSGPHPLQASARPHTAVFNAESSAAYATDLGSDRLSHIDLTGSTPTVQTRVSFPPGSGPAHLALHPSGKLLVVSTRLRPGLTLVPIDPDSNQLQTPTHHLALEATEAGPIAFSPSGNRLYATTTKGSGNTTTIETFRLSRSTGRLKPTNQSLPLATPTPTQLHPAGTRLHLVSLSGITTIDTRTNAHLFTNPSPAMASLTLRSV